MSWKSICELGGCVKRKRDQSWRSLTALSSLTVITSACNLKTLSCNGEHAAVPSIYSLLQGILFWLKSSKLHLRC